MKKAGWIILIVLAFLFLSNSKKSTVLPDGYQFYDDFEAGSLTPDLWIVYNNSDNVGVTNGQLSLGGMGWNVGDRQPTVGTSRNWTTENLKIPYSISYSQSDVCAPDGSPCFRNPRMYYNQQNIPLVYYCSPASGGDNMIECTGTGLAEIRRYDDFDLSKYVIVVNGQEYGTGQQVGPEKLYIKGGGLLVPEVKWQPYFSCAINYDTEVVVRDTFGSTYPRGTQVNINNLAYFPLKFCPDDLGVLIFSNQGLTNELGSITRALARGETSTVPAGEYWQVYYVTSYVNNMTERCGDPGQVYDTETRTCGQVAQQIYQTGDILYCNATSSCYIPVQCPSTTAACVDNLCHYDSDTCTNEQIINYIIGQMVTEITIPQIIIVNTGTNSVGFTAAGNPPVAGHPWIIDGIEVNPDTCPTSHGYVQGVGCYGANVEWGPYSFNALNGQVTHVTPYIDVQFELQGAGAYVGEHGGQYYNYTFIPGQEHQYYFVVTFKNVFGMTLQGYTERVLINQEQEVTLEITNHIHALQDAGYQIQISKLLRGIFEPTQTIPQPLAAGATSYNIALPTDEVGSYVVEITPYFMMKDNRMYSGNEKMIFGYYVAPPNVTLDCHQLPCTIGECQADGTCLVTQDCHSYGCPLGYTCQSEGICLRTDIISCPSTPCPGGYFCNLVHGYCQLTNTVYVNHTVYLNNTISCINTPNVCPTDAECDTNSGVCIKTAYIKPEDNSKMILTIGGIAAVLLLLVMRRR